MEEFQFPIDRFRAVGSWMSEVERRLNAAEGEVKRLTDYTRLQADKIKELEEFKRSVQIVIRQNTV